VRGLGKALSKVLRAKDGPKEAHMDVLVASFESAFPKPRFPTARNEKTRQKAGFLKTNQKS